MEIEILLAVGMFAAAIAALLAGYPVAFTLGGTALLFALMGIGLGVFPDAFLKGYPARIQGAMENQVLIAVPLFVIMGVILERSRVAEDLLHIASRLLGRLRGGLGYAVVIVGALLAASTGIVGATVITMTLIALPSMLRQGYDPRLAAGTIAASGTLGQIIPPSIVLILLADAISNANQTASMAGGGGPSVVSVGDLFAGALVPGLLLVFTYLIYIAASAWMRPASCPPLQADSDDPALTTQEIVFGLGAPLLLIMVVLGAILGGVASPTEAAAVGAGGAILLAGLRLSREDEMPGWVAPVLISGLISLLTLFLLANLMDLRVGREEISAGDWAGILFAGLLSLAFLVSLASGLYALSRASQLLAALKSASNITSMVFMILIGASLFALVFRGFGGDDLVTALLSAMPGGKWGALALTMLVMFVLGFFLDFIEIVFVVVPLVAPPLILLGFDPIWLAILMALNLQTSFLTPPFGFALFYLRGAAPDELATLDIWRGAVPFIGLQLFIIACVAGMPWLATWLPALAAN
ncbi:MAG: TRAP transporter large permease subunit [Hyphomonadaceae bacterium]|nr:TRAP transporter large permease subunit [Hyphomonadaceae bacterium]